MNEKLNLGAVMCSDYNGEMKMNEKKTLRDEFAMCALTALMSATNQEGDWTTINCEKDIADKCYHMADLMMKERSKRCT